MKITIEVTHDDIRNGKACDSYLCPVAIAMSRALKKTVAVGYTGWYMDYMDIRDYDSNVPRYFIEAFDYGKQVIPIRFQVEIPDAEVSSPRNAE